MFDVGQHVSTPRGKALIVAVNVPADTVETDRGTFPTSQVAPWLNREAITASPESLEAWLDEEPEPVPDQRIIGESRACRCPCGKKGNCHRLVHVDVVAEVDVKVFPHSVITGECRCLMRDCACAY